MTNEEAIEHIENIPNDGLTMNEIEALEIAIEAIEKQAINDKTSDKQTNKQSVSKYRWHDLRKNPNDLPKTSGFSFFPCLILMEYSSIPKYAEYEFFEGYGWGFYGIDLKSIIAWREIEPLEVEE